MALGRTRSIKDSARWALADFRLAVNGTVLLLLRTQRPPPYLSYGRFFHLYDPTTKLA